MYYNIIYYIRGTSSKCILLRFKRLLRYDFTEINLNFFRVKILPGVKVALRDEHLQSSLSEVFALKLVIIIFWFFVFTR